ALRLVSVQRGYDLRDFALIAYGGAGPVHAGALARAAGIGRVVVPVHSGAFSALGCLVSPLRYEGIAHERIVLERSADLRYSGQNYELEVEWRSTPEALRTAFEARHRQLYGYATGEGIECVNLRVVARVPDVAVDLPPCEPVAAREPSGEQ